VRDRYVKALPEWLDIWQRSSQIILSDGDDGDDDEIDDTPTPNLVSAYHRILFADIGSLLEFMLREPTQVFILLQTIYQAFIDLAKSRKVFKVETIGDLRCLWWSSKAGRKTLRLNVPIRIRLSHTRRTYE
jgi:hypothetical protein